MEGFYKQAEDGSWIYAENFVYGPTFELLRELKDTYIYPVEGWSWYNEKPYQDIEPEISDIPNDSFLNIPLI